MEVPHRAGGGVPAALVTCRWHRFVRAARRGAARAAQRHMEV